ncbi:exopolygalacturonase-like [Humulus lupulus]|uniref:exopolygalacturonase-like n=1 Tax=Humulus lupulus TaxID=3486 RepID=UPI002B417B99|nr:exopolygalacturonase-like [Humulus lupulus]
MTCLSLLLGLTLAANPSVFDVRTYGAKPNMDISQALSTAWKNACASLTQSELFIPNGVFYLKRAILQGPCKAPIKVQLQGTLRATNDLTGFNEEDGWVTFKYINGLTLMGGGTFDGQGKSVWGKQCGQGKYCSKLPMNIRFDYITNSLVRDIISLDSKQFHMNVLGCQNVTFLHVRAIASGSSPNTDGIHIGRSFGINITDAHIQTGDDCVSLGDGSKKITITKVTCGPGHGISVGSLGLYKNEQPVEGVFVRNCTLINTMNGVRIKTWPDSFVGSASDIHFEDIIMENSGNPILIDQEYCLWNKCNKKVPSKIQIKDVTFKDIRGTSATANAINLICSSGFPCQNIELVDIDLKYNGQGHITSQCKNVKPKILGVHNPTACLAN